MDSSLTQYPCDSLKHTGSGTAISQKHQDDLLHTYFGSLLSALPGCGTTAPPPITLRGILVDVLPNLDMGPIVLASYDLLGTAVGPNVFYSQTHTYIVKVK